MELKLKDFLKITHLRGHDYITVCYKNPRSKLNETIKSINIKKYLEVSVINYKRYDSECIDPIRNIKMPCFQYCIELDWYEVKLIKEREKQAKERK